MLCKSLEHQRPETAPELGLVRDEQGRRQRSDEGSRRGARQGSDSCERHMSCSCGDGNVSVVFTLIILRF